MIPRSFESRNDVRIRGVFGAFAVCAVLLAVIATGTQQIALAALAAGAIVFLLLLRPEFGVAILTFSLFVSAPAVLANNYGFSSLTNVLTAVLGCVVILRFLARGEIGRDLFRVAFVIFLYVTSLAVTAIYAGAPELTFAEVEDISKRGVVALLIVALVSDWRRFQWAIGGIIAGAVLVSVISVVQVSFDMYESDFGGLGNAQIQQIAGDLVSWRLSGPLSDSNYYAQTLLLALPFGLITLRHSRSTLWWIIGPAIAMLIGFAVIFTFSRGAIVAVGVVLIALLWHRRVLMLGVGVALALALVLAFEYLPGGYFDRLDAAMRDVASMLKGEGYITDLAVAGRLAEMLAAIHLFLENPILGVGYGQFEILYQDTARNFGLMARGSDRQAHSLYLEILAERGVVGALAFAALLAFMFVSIIRSASALSANSLDFEAGWAKAFGLGVLGFMCAAVFLHEAYPHYFWLAFGIAASLPQAASSLLHGTTAPRYPGR
jgi:putative inorganic carbon (hco3(-)) transporter